MDEGAPEPTAELVVDGVVPSRPVISPDECWVAYVVALTSTQTSALYATADGGAQWILRASGTTAA